MAFVVAMMAACGGQTAKTEQAACKQDSTVINTVPQWSERDTTIYGRADGFGQGAFTLITDDSLEYDIALTSPSDEQPYGIVYGDREEGARYAMTTRNNDEELIVLINLTQLEKFTTDYSIYNGHLILSEGANRDLVEVLELNDETFRAKGKSGKLYEFHR